VESLQPFLQVRDGTLEAVQSRQQSTNRMTFEGYLSFMQLAHNQSAKLQALNSEMPSRLRCRLSNHRNRTTLCRDRIAASETVRLGTPDFQL